MKPEVSVLCSQQPVSGRYSGPDYSVQENSDIIFLPIFGLTSDLFKVYSCLAHITLMIFGKGKYYFTDYMFVHPPTHRAA
jgi:hypothetical protein